MSDQLAAKLAQRLFSDFVLRFGVAERPRPRLSQLVSKMYCGFAVHRVVGA